MYLTGVYTALITPFRNGRVDVDGLRQLTRRQIAAGVDGILALGTTAETPTLSHEEQEVVLRTIFEECHGKVTLIAGTGTNATATSVVKAQWAQTIGADALLVVAPYYNKPTQRGIFHHFEAICNEVDIPVIVYNIPGRTGVNIDPLTLREIAELPNVVGIKESSGNIEQAADMIHVIGNPSRPFSLLSGDDANTLPIMALGGRGAFSVLSNLTPERVVSLVRALDEGNYEEARRVHYELLPICKALFLETNPMPIKEAMNFCGLPAGPCRLPLCEMSTTHRDSLLRILKAHGFAPVGA